MKQGMFVILLIATISVVGYTLYQSYPERMTPLLGIRASQPTPPPTPSPIPTAPALVAKPTIVVIVPTPHNGPTKLPVTGARDARHVWSDTPMVALLIGLIITSTTAFWLGRRH